MKVLLTSTSYPAVETDWKGLFIRRMVEGISSREDVTLSLWAPPGPIPQSVKSELAEDDRIWLQALSDSGGIAHRLRRTPLRGILSAVGILRRMRRAVGRSKAEVLHLNWLQSALAVPDTLRVPQVVTALGTDVRLLAVPGMRAALRHVFGRRPSIICPNAAWMVGPLQRAFDEVAQVVHVPFGIDPMWYSLRRSPDQERRMWLVVSRLTRAKLGTLFEWSEPQFLASRRELHLFGPMQENIKIPRWVHYHGPVTPQRLAHDWFPHAQGLLSLSVHDEGLPQVMLEAMASGLPIVASRLPAHDELLGAGFEGQLCRSASEFQDAIEQLEDPAENRDKGLLSRLRVESFAGTWADCAARYVACYRQILECTR